MTRATSQGVTLVELLITLSLIAILLALAAPPFRDMILNNRRAAQLNALTGSLNLARSAAVKGGSDAVVCISDGAAPPDCDSDGTQWEAGWLVIVDSNKEGPVSRADGDFVLEVHGALAEGTTLRGDSNRIRYTSRGNSRDPGTLLMCDSRGPEAAGGIVISPSGRSKLATDADKDGTVEDGSGNEFTTCPWSD